MTPDAIRAALTERQALLLTLYGEAANQSLEGQVAVACVVRNRAAAPGHWGGPDLLSVCLSPHQFSCWWGDDANTARLYQMAEWLVTGTPIRDPLIAELGWIADGTLAGVVRDRVQGATHYLTAALYRANPPVWARGKAVQQVGTHVFLVA